MVLGLPGRTQTPGELIIYFDLPKLCSYLSSAGSNGIRWIQWCARGENCLSPQTAGVILNVSSLCVAQNQVSRSQSVL